MLCERNLRPEKFSSYRPKWCPPKTHMYKANVVYKAYVLPTFVIFGKAYMRFTAYKWTAWRATRA
ncbi:hypothetical protein B9Q00_06735 [Candidatus Marsarchaeota G1 archaeon OSP_C]|uniref:Uncharacterized protein n=1 Tax=Candidatus Marsarchaeota G1 archaeon OSP_C TaxID=1978154 RepID=A0A2R6AP66_9ARCH|nr:MAG: hypothetical protein B9Q00_06735 [Candidatus Marsarchaeota G1 archaeon OSP_C]